MGLWLCLSPTERPQQRGECGPGCAVGQELLELQRELVRVTFVCADMR